MYSPIFCISVESASVADLIDSIVPPSFSFFRAVIFSLTAFLISSGTLGEPACPSAEAGRSFRAFSGLPGIFLFM